MKYPLAPQGVFRTIQGEGALLGVPMVFIRLAGCSVGCAGCDTNYAQDSVRSLAEIEAAIQQVRGNCGWVFITGGEPADHDLTPLLKMARTYGKIALVTSGRKELGGHEPIDFLTVSPHGTPDQLVVLRGSQVNLVPGLGGTRLKDWETFYFSGFPHKYVTPFDKNPATVAECLSWVDRRTEWRLGVQAHKTWGIA